MANDSSISHVAVTGATGFVGSHIVDRLLADGYRVHVHARDRHKASIYENKAASTAICDITDGEALKKLFKGVDVVIHTVSNFRTASGPPQSYRNINVEGTRTAIDAAKSEGVRRFIHCSTIGVHGHVSSTPADESSPFNPGDLYQETKLEAEEVCRSAMQDQAMEIVILRPCSVYGPGDMRMLKMFSMLKKRTFLMAGPCRENFHAVYIDDLVEGFMLAMVTPGIGGETFLIGGDRYLPLRDYIRVAADAVGAPVPWIRLPYSPLYAAAVLCEWLCVPLRIEPPLHRRRVRFYRNNRAFSFDKARRILGYEPKTSLEQGMHLTVEWYREQGYLSSEQ